MSAAQVFQHTLTGLSAIDTLGFMAALGCLRALDDRARTESHPAPALAFCDQGGWVPVLHTHHPRVEDIIDALCRDLESWKQALVLAFEYLDAKGNRVRDIKAPPDRFASFAHTILDQTSPASRDQADMLSAWASSVARDKGGATKPTALHFMAGQQRFLEQIHKIVHGEEREPGIQADDFHDALLGPWPYRRKLPTLGWEAGSQRIYALRATDPSPGKDKSGVPAADWLAVRALPFFQCAPRGARLYTTACTGGWKTGRFIWPLWHDPAPVAAIASLLRANDWRTQSPGQRLERGIVAVFESRISRTEQGGYGSFGPARPHHPDTDASA